MNNLQLNNLKDYLVQGVLGRGNEGTVYLVRHRNMSGKLVLKLFHEARTGDWLPGLVVYAEKVRTNSLGLPEVKLLFDGDKIAGATYPYTRLAQLHWRILNSMDQVAQSIVGSYCHMQYYLLSRYGLALCEPNLSHLMMDNCGKWHYLDIGGGIGLLTHSYLLRRGLIGYGFASMLMSIYGKNLFDFMLPVEGYSYEMPCVYCRHEWLDHIAMQHPWLKDILSCVRGSKSSVFLDPGFYHNLTENLPDRVPHPSLVLPMSNILFKLGRLRGKLGV